MSRPRARYLIRALLTTLGALLLVGAMATSAHGQSSAKVAAAEALFKEAVALARSGRYEQAIEKFQASYDLDPALGTLLGLAMAEQEAGRLATALGHYVLLGEEARRADDRDRTRIAERRTQELEARVPRLSLVTPGPLPPGAVVTLDGESLPPGALGSALPVDPGRHDVRVEAPGKEPFVRSVELREGSREVIRLALAPAAVTELGVTPAPLPPPPPQERRWTPLRTAGVVTALMGLGLAGAGGVLLYQSGRTYEDLRRDCAGGTICPPNRSDDIETGRRQEIWGQVALGVGGVIAAGGVALVLVPVAPPARAAAIRVGPGGVTFQGHF